MMVCVLRGVFMTKRSRQMKNSLSFRSSSARSMAVSALVKPLAIIATYCRCQKMILDLRFESSW